MAPVVQALSETPLTGGVEYKSRCTDWRDACCAPLRWSSLCTSSSSSSLLVSVSSCTWSLKVMSELIVSTDGARSLPARAITSPIEFTPRAWVAERLTLPTVVLSSTLMISNSCLELGVGSAKAGMTGTVGAGAAGSDCWDSCEPKSSMRRGVPCTSLPRRPPFTTTVLSSSSSSSPSFSSSVSCW